MSARNTALADSPTVLRSPTGVTVTAASKRGGSRIPLRTPPPKEASSKASRQSRREQIYNTIRSYNADHTNNSCSSAPQSTSPTDPTEPTETASSQPAGTVTPPETGPATPSPQPRAAPVPPASSPPAASPAVPLKSAGLLSSDRAKQHWDVLKGFKLLPRSEPEITLEAIAGALRILGTGQIKKSEMMSAAASAGELVTLILSDQRLDLIAYTDKIGQHIDDKLEEGFTRLTTSIVENPPQCTHAHPTTPATNSEEPMDAQAFFDAVVAGLPTPPGSDRDFQARKAEAILARQVLFTHCGGDLPEGKVGVPPNIANAALADHFRDAIKKGDIEKDAGCNIGIQTVRRVGMDVVVLYRAYRGINPNKHRGQASRVFLLSQ
ncbi:unnamed protein product [Peniophora sp. CBMAI 1063]|nr:unnamed protein product [Peniophora sp. CBMAI 1063]